MTTRTWGIAAVVFVVCLAAFHIWANHDATELALNNECEPEGLTAVARANYQGSRFWQSQVAAIDTEIEGIYRQEARRQEIEARFDEISVEHRKFIERLESEIPTLRPSAAKQEAEELRREARELEERADAIESAQFREMLMEWLATCRMKANQSATER